MLCEMGFPETRVRRALILQYSDTQEALNWLLTHEDDPNADEPLSQQEVRKQNHKISFYNGWRFIYCFFILV